MAVVPSPNVRAAVAESLNRDLSRVSEWCNLWGMKLNAGKTKTMIVSRSRTMHLQSPTITVGGTVLMESVELDILEVTFDSRLSFENHFRSISRSASQRLGILRKFWRVFFMIGCSSRDAFVVLFCLFWSTVLQCGALLLIHTLNYGTG